MTHQALGGFQQLVLLAALRLDREAYGARIQREIEETAGRSVTLSTLYITMERLEKKGLVRSWMTDPTPVRGGKSKRCYRLTEEGLLALSESRRELVRMWRGVESHLEGEL